MMEFLRRLARLLFRDFSVNSRQAQTAQLQSVKIGVQTSEADVLSRLAELERVLRHER